MHLRDEIIHFLDVYLNAPAVPDDSQNGLQVAGAQHVQKVVFGVSASLELFRRAHSSGAQMVVVHHGLLWGKEQRITGMFKDRLAFLFKHDLNLAAYHLPLDKHPAIGHNALLMKALSATDVEPFGDYHGQQIGYKGRLANASLVQVRQTLEAFCGGAAVALAYGPERIGSVAVVSGGAWSMLPQAAAEKIDLYITGSLEEPVQEWCRDGQINCLGLGHYHSEKCGVQALCALVAKEFNIETEFIDIPNPF